MLGLLALGCSSSVGPVGTDAGGAGHADAAVDGSGGAANAEAGADASGGVDGHGCTSEDLQLACMDCMCPCDVRCENGKLVGDGCVCPSLDAGE